MDISSISAAYEGLKIGKSLLQSIYEKKAEEISEEKIREIMEKLGIAQDTLFSMREVLFELQEKNKELNAKIADIESWEARAASYTLVKTSGGAVVYESQQDPRHYVCPSCFENKNIHILQDMRSISGEYRCVACGAVYPINPAQEVQIAPTEHNW